MCGRFSLAKTDETILEYLFDQFEIKKMDNSVSFPKYNIAPGQKILSVVKGKDGFKVGEIKWGFVPSFSKDESIGFKMINARGETVDSKISFKNSFAHRRCLVVADGYYEWSDKVPYRITRTNNELFMMAGLWEKCMKDDGTVLYTCTIITTSANSKLSEIHDRMPVILDNTDAGKWLSPDSSLIDIKNLIKPYDEESLEYYRVSDYVNKASNQDKKCIEGIK